MKASCAALATIVASCLVAACGSAGVGRSSPAPAALVPIGAGLQGPAGLTATRYAAGLPRAAAFAFDSEGRLWVATADSTDTGHDGVYVVPAANAAPVEVVSGVHTPLGLLWYQGSLFVSSAGRVDAYSGFTGTAFAATRTVVTFPAGGGEVNDLVVSPAGRLVLGISAPCDHCVPTSSWSAAVVSFRPDGTDLRVDASGIRAPVGLAYYPGTDVLLATMNQRDDLGSATPGDVLAVVRPGQAWHFPSCYGQGGPACPGVPAATAVLDPHAAVSQVAVVTNQLGTALADSALVAEWATGKVLRVALSPSASGFTGVVHPFLTGVARPVAVAVAPGGALFVADWSSGVVFRVTGHDG